MSPTDRNASRGQRFRPADRVRRRADFDRIYQQSAYAADDTLVVRGCLNDLPRSRLGLAVSRQVGNAVVRNRWKRLVREAFRRHRSDVPTGLDLVVRPRRGASPVFPRVEESLVRLTRNLARRLGAKSS
jgi:ribonuclease P protein component